jgi:hypothetical protein
MQDGPIIAGMARGQSLVILSLGIALTCCAGGGHEPRALPPPPTLTAVQDPAMRRFLLDAATSQACPKTLRKFIALPSKADEAMMGGPDAGIARVAGRWFIQECTQEPSDGQTLSLTIGGTGWIWVDQSEGDYAKFGVRQYVYFSARASIRWRLDVAYDTNALVASVWMTPTVSPSVNFWALGAVNAHPESFLARLATRFAPRAVGAEAVKKAEAKGKLQFEAALTSGATITYKTSDGQQDLMLGLHAQGVVPRRPLNLAKWLANERQELHAGGLQIAGPYAYSQTAQLAVSVDEGSDFQYGTACATDAQFAVAQLASGQVQPRGSTAMRVMRGGQRYFGPLNPPACEWVLVTSSQSDTSVTLGVVP